MNSFPNEIRKLDEIRENEMQNFIYNKNFKRGVLISSGKYTEQNFYSIMVSKLYDIKQNGFCFWAHNYVKTNQTIKLYSSFFECEGDKYLLMTYTDSNAYAGNGRLNIMEDESIDHYYHRMWNTVKNDSKIYYAKEYKYHKGEYNACPNGMFPITISNNNEKKSGVAYLISEFNYLTENIELKDLCNLFVQYTATKGFCTDCNYCDRPNHRLVELKKTPELLLPEKIKKTNEITYVIAKLKYPYLVQLKF